MRPRLLVVLGPTAAGKSALAVALAEELGGEVLNFDSRQVYRGLDIGTAKPTPAERARVPHHLFDLVEPEETFSAARLGEAALRVAAEVAGRGRLPILVGGTGLYLRATLEGIFAGPGRDPVRHARLERIVERGGLPRLYRWLARVDPDWAGRVGPRDRQRILRGLDVYSQSGRGISEHIRAMARAEPPFVVYKLGLDVPRPLLHARIDRRVLAMMESGFLDEVRRLAGRAGFARSNAAKAVGYRPLLEHLAGRLDLGQAVALVQRDTRRLAKRQLTWFRREPDVEWVPATSPEEALGLARERVRRRFLGAPEARLLAAV